MMGQIVAPGTQAYYDSESGLWYWTDAISGKVESSTVQPQSSPPGPLQPSGVQVYTQGTVPPTASMSVQIENWLGQNWSLVAVGLGVLIFATAFEKQGKRR